MANSKVLKTAESGKKRPPNAGKGRQKGVLNKNTANIKAMIEGALNASGGQAYFEQQAAENPVAFMALVGKILPKEIAATIDVNYANELTKLREAAKRAKEHVGN